MGKIRSIVVRCTEEEHSAYSDVKGNVLWDDVFSLGIAEVKSLREKGLITSDGKILIEEK